MTQKERSLVSKNSNSLNAMIKKTSMTIRRQNINGKKLLMTIAASTVLLGGIFALGFEAEMIAFAAKPDGSNGSKNVIASSNGFPSGPHFNLGIHGKVSFDSENCVGDGGKSVFTPLNSTDGAQDEDQILQMFVNKKGSLTTLVVKDKCTDAFDGDPAQVQLPNKINTDEGLVNIDQGFYVFARVLGTPNHGGPNGDISNIALWPDPQIEACDLFDNATGTESDCFDENNNKQEFVELGYATKNGIYKCDEFQTCEDQGLVRYDEIPKGKGAKKAVDITPLFLWSGVGCVDSEPFDGIIDINDFNATVAGEDDEIDPGDTLNGETIELVAHIQAAEDAVANDGDAGTVTNDNDIIDNEDEFDALLKILGQDTNFTSCVYEEDKWVFDVFGADLVIQNQTLTNDGVKNLQIRFYPNQTTTFNPGY